MASSDAIPKTGLPSILPKHIAIIMDGNGRWAQKRGVPRIAGHVAGAETFRKIGEYCQEIGIQILTVYAFSTENWKRPWEEVQAIFGLLEKYADEALRRSRKEHVKMRFLGAPDQLPDIIREKINQVNAMSETIEGVTFNVCVNYGSRDEILRAASQVMAKSLPMTKENLEAHLDTAGLPDPDFCIRPSGEKRLSNFLLWQCAYTELFFTDTLWPDFNKEELRQMLWEFSMRDRRYGGLENKKGV